MRRDSNTRFSASHEWARKDGDAFVVGISDHAQTSLGDIVFAELPDEGTKVTAGVSCAVIESVKAASDIYAPLSGVITAVNAALASDPGLVNKDCYGEGWLLKIKADNPADWDTLMNSDDYEKTL
jgi:glycine cleavage system H protein